MNLALKYNPKIFQQPEDVERHLRDILLRKAQEGHYLSAQLEKAQEKKDMCWDGLMGSVQ